LVDFKNTVIIATSNIGAQVLQEHFEKKKAGFDEKTRDEVFAQLRGFFRPEFLNRLDEIVLFAPLKKAEVAQIFDLLLSQTVAKLAVRGIYLELEKKVRDLIVDAGFDAEFGARPLAREIQRRLENPLAMKLLSSEIKDGAKIKAVLDKKGEIEFKV
jgi:ATP-dependent Clp protease ATP-binding subunit ClpA